MIKKENDLLSNWKAKLAILTAIVFPTVTATGAFYGLKANMADTEYSLTQKINNVQLEVEKNFADKRSLDEIKSDIKEIQRDIKLLLLKKDR